MPTTNQLIQNNNINRATSNPQVNVNNAQPINTQLVQQPQIQTLQQGQQVNTISAPTNLQTINNSQPVKQEQYNVPTPVEYQQPQTSMQNANVQSVYNNYQSQYRNNVQFPDIDIQIDNANSIEGQFKSSYSDALNQLVSSVIKSYASYNYDPNSDELLKQATKYTTQNTYESMNARGILNSSLTAERVTQVVGELIPQYEKMAREEFETSISRLINVANLLGNMSDREFAYWQDARDQKWKEEERDYQRKLDALETAWKRVDELGYVDNEAAIVLGVQAGTLSKDAREAKEAYERQIEEWNRQHEIEKQTEKELLQLKQQLEKDMYDYQSQQEINSYEKQLQLQQKYGTSQTSSSSGSSSSASSNKYISLSNYEGILQNRYLTQDIEGNYTAKNNDDLYNYLVQEYENGRMSYNDMLTLWSKYASTSNETSVNSTKSVSNILTKDNYETWRKAIDGNNQALKKLGVTINGGTQGWYNNNSIKRVLDNALAEISSGKRSPSSNQELMDQIIRGDFGTLEWGF